MKFIFCALIIFITLHVAAQNKLLFTNADSSQKIVLKQKDLVRFSYTGYMNQLQEAEGYIATLNDSIVTITPRKKFLQKAKPNISFFIKDINGFRLFSKARPAAEIVYTFLSVGITGTVTAIIANANVPSSLSFLCAAGTQTVTTIFKNVFFSNAVKNNTNNGWTLQLIKP